MDESAPSLRYAAAKQPQVATAKGERTRELILETALRLFYERGWRKTTMRGIAAEAGVSLGNAYYYFHSKESLIQAIYAQSHEEHMAACQGVLATEISFGARLQGVMKAKLDTLARYHSFAGVLFATAADPRSPLNPWSEASAAVRRQSIALFAEVVAGSDARIPKWLRPELPGLLWTYHMGIILFWVHDRSPDRRASYQLARRTVELINQLVALARVPLLRPLVQSVLALLGEIRAAA
ncbi:MAG TPA: TetR family transcriptional regulator [Thermoanaerobaculia bacterium]|jgi:AcrR family transcriptional regulator|nr:TetR family transcriptional regulator [Thermoanaerobaculia bacterium]